jgi:hypothetical protein
MSNANNLSASFFRRTFVPSRNYFENLPVISADR